MAYYVWPSEPLKQGFRPYEIYAPRSSMLAYDLERILR